MIETTELQYVECDIEQLTKQRDNHQMEVGDLNRALADLRKQRRDLMLTEAGIKHGDKLLMTNEAHEHVYGAPHLFTVGTICKVSDICNNQDVVISYPKAERLMPLSVVLKMKIAYEESVKV